MWIGSGGGGRGAVRLGGPVGGRVLLGGVLGRGRGLCRLLLLWLRLFYLPSSMLIYSTVQSLLMYYCVLCIDYCVLIIDYVMYSLDYVIQSKATYLLLLLLTNSLTNSLTN